MNPNISSRKIVVGITGASGVIYAFYALQILKQANIETHLIISKSAQKIISEELTDINLSDFTKLATQVYENYDIGSLPASGGFMPSSMLIIPCSLNTALSIASGVANNLILRSAQVHLKEGAKVVMLLRETPLASHHLRNLSNLPSNAVVMPASPFFYHKPTTMEELIKPLIYRALNRLGLYLN